MFTGIVEQIGEIVALEVDGPSMRIGVRCAFEGLRLGESISVTACV